MGYAYGHNGRLVCDSCGEAQGRTRRRTCRFRVRSHDGTSLPYCPAPALCPTCWERQGKGRGVHGDRCRDGAARSQQREDAIAARLAAGGAHVRSAWGPGHDSVPDGYVGVRFVDQDGHTYDRLIPQKRYRARTLDHGNWLDDYPDAATWDGPATASMPVPSP